MKDDSILGFFASFEQPFDVADDEEAKFEKLSIVFRGYIWGEGGLSHILKGLRYGDYGSDLRKILIQFQVFPGKNAIKNYEEVEKYRPKEKAIGLTVFVTEDNFFNKNPSQRVEFLKNAILERLAQLAAIIEAENLDTDIEKLIFDTKRNLS